MKYLLILIVLFFTSCSNIQDKIKNAVQSENAKQIRNDYQEIVQLLSLYKTKLDKRNPKNYNNNLTSLLRKNILDNKNTINLFSHTRNHSFKYTDYLNLAFNKSSSIKNRNDYLAVGLYKMFYDAYKMDVKYKMTALSYDLEVLQKAYKNLQILQWKIKFDKDIEEQYLFLTWQNNWQIELEQQLKTTSLSNIPLSQLKNIQLQKESLLDPSNNSFEIITSKMILYMERSIKMLHAEPENLTIDALLSVIFII
ncbi:hypothetical protein OAR97_03600 [Arcobacteraceae bacterium]|nr:hypothetical protein [Arcobacteraceae bacterium]